MDLVGQVIDVYLKNTDRVEARLPESSAKLCVAPMSPDLLSKAFLALWLRFCDGLGLGRAKVRVHLSHSYKHFPVSFGLATSEVVAVQATSAPPTNFDVGDYEVIF